MKVAASTAWEILKNAGIDPAPRRTAPTWSQFLRSQADAILACDLFTADLLDGTQSYVLAVIEHASRRIRILGVTLYPTSEWTAQQARNLLMDLDDQAHRVKFMIRDRGSNFTDHVRRRSRRCRDPDRALQCPDAPHETSGCILHLLWSVRRVLGVVAGGDGSGGVGQSGGFMCCRRGR